MEPALREIFIFGMFSTTAILLIVHFKSTSNGLIELMDGWKEERNKKKTDLK